MAYDEDYDDADPHWLCACGSYNESSLHCPACHGQPPWGCDCSACDEDVDDDAVDWPDPYTNEGIII